MTVLVMVESAIFAGTLGATIGREDLPEQSEELGSLTI
jgi:hypothetical protein